MLSLQQRRQFSIKSNLNPVAATPAAPFTDKPTPTPSYPNPIITSPNPCPPNPQAQKLAYFFPFLSSPKKTITFPSDKQLHHPKILSIFSMSYWECKCQGEDGGIAGVCAKEGDC